MGPPANICGNCSGNRPSRESGWSDGDACTITWSRPRHYWPSRQQSQYNLGSTKGSWQKTGLYKKHLTIAFLVSKQHARYSRYLNIVWILDIVWYLVSPDVLYNKNNWPESKLYWREDLHPYLLRVTWKLFDLLYDLFET